MKGERIDRFRLLEHRDDDRWNVVLFLWAGISPAIDVVAFIEQSINDNHQALAYGILSDQYERIPAETRKELILKVDELKHFRKMSLFWGVPGWPAKKDFRYAIAVPSGAFTTLSGRQGGFGNETIQGLLIAAINDNTISWSDVSAKQGALGELVFLLFITTPTKDWKNVLGVWQERLKKPNYMHEKDVKERYEPDVKDWRNIDQLEWSFFISGRIFSWWNFDKNFDLLDFYKIYKKHFLKSIGFVIFAMMSSVVDFSDKDFKRKPKISVTKYMHCLRKIFLEEDIENIPREYLLGTRKWKFWSRDFRVEEKEKTYDLFVEFKKSLEKGISLSVAENNEDVKKLLIFTDKLSALRDQIS